MNMNYYSFFIMFVNLFIYEDGGKVKGAKEDKGYAYK